MENENRKVKHVQFHVAVEALGSILSYRSRKDSKAFETAIGVEMRSATRIVIVPYSNIRSYEVENK